MWILGLKAFSGLRVVNILKILCQIQDSNISTVQVPLLVTTGIFLASVSWYRGLIILSFAGKLTQSWNPSDLPPFFKTSSEGISLCTTPDPAVIHCTQPGFKTPLFPALS